MSASQVIKVRLVLTPDPSGGFVVTCPDIPELVTEGDTAAEAVANVRDAVDAVRELYADTGRPFPATLQPQTPNAPVAFETLIEAA